MAPPVPVATPVHKVYVASLNPVKMNAAKVAVSRLLPTAQIELVGVDVASGVPDQPVGDDETLQG